MVQKEPKTGTPANSFAENSYMPAGNALTEAWVHIGGRYKGNDCIVTGYAAGYILSARVPGPPCGLYAVIERVDGDCASSLHSCNDHP